MINTPRIEKLTVHVCTFQRRKNGPIEIGIIINENLIIDMDAEPITGTIFNYTVQPLAGTMIVYDHQIINEVNNHD